MLSKTASFRAVVASSSFLMGMDCLSAFFDLVDDILKVTAFAVNFLHWMPTRTLTPGSLTKMSTPPCPWPLRPLIRGVRSPKTTP